MLDRSLTVLLTVTIAAQAYGARINKQVPTLLDSVNVVANGLQVEQPANDTVSSTPEPAPGKLNVCENLCPKWCQKVDGVDRTFTNCHYVCGNLCNKKTWWSNNPFIGNASYEVVPSEYDFAKYDLDANKLISMEEFARVEAVTIDEVIRLFTFSDFSKDGFMDTDEFHGGPLIFTVQMAAELSSIARKDNAVVTSP